MTKTTTVILGGGVGGIAAANSLRALVGNDHDILVVDASPRFHVGAGKTWVMLGARTYDQISQSREALLAPGVRFIESKVTRIGLDDLTVTLEREALDWDHLVIALGADLKMGGVPGLAEHAHTFYTIAGAQKLKVALEQLSGGGEIVLLIPKAPFKCPPAPYEAAMLIHHALGRRGHSFRARIAIHTVEGSPMTTAGPEMGEFIKAELAQRGIGFFPQRAVKRVEDRRVVFEHGDAAHFDLLIAVPPHEAPAVVREAKLAGPSGWIPVDSETMEVKPTGAPSRSVWAIGDVTGVTLPGRYKPDVPLALPKAGVFADAQGRTVARQVADRIEGRTPTDRFDGKGFCYLETGGGRAVRAEGSFFERPHPVMQKRMPDEAQLREKEKWVDEQLKARR